MTKVFLVELTIREDSHADFLVDKVADALAFSTAREALEEALVAEVELRLIRELRYEEQADG